MKSYVDVVVPIYKVEDYLPECVDSVIRQTYSEIECLLVDDGTPDSSGEMCDEYALRNHNIVSYHRTNGGLSAARNTGMDAAAGEYIYFLDSDDYIADNAIETLVNKAKSESADMVFFDGESFYDGCEKPDNAWTYIRKNEYPVAKGRDQLVNLLQTGEYRTAVPLHFFRRDYLKKNNLSFYEGIIHEDEHFTFLAFMADGAAAHCNKALYQRRVRPFSIMTASNLKYSFESLLSIYYDLSERYNDSEYKCETSRLYLIRTAKGVTSKYKLLDDAGREQCKKEYADFRKSVLRFHGFGDMKLKIKCSDGLRNVYYRLSFKFTH